MYPGLSSGRSAAVKHPAKVVSQPVTSPGDDYVGKLQDQGLRQGGAHLLQPSGAGGPVAASELNIEMYRIDQKKGEVINKYVELNTNQAGQPYLLVMPVVTPLSSKTQK